MRISSRTRRILALLLQSEHDLTAAQIAAHIQVSARTVYRELASVERILNMQGVKLIKKSGAGISLEGDSAALDSVAKLITITEDIAFTPDERKIYLLCLLLDSTEPIKLYTLAHECKVTISTVANDLDELVGSVNKFGIDFIRRRGYGIELYGAEEQLRALIRHVTKLRFDDTALIAKKEEHVIHPLDQRVLSLAGHSEMETVENILWHWEQHWGTQLSEYAYTELLIRLSIALARIRSGKMIGTFATPTQAKPSHLSDTSKVTEITKKLMEQIGQPFPAAENAYIEQLLRSAQANEFAVQPVDDLPLIEKVRLLIEYVQDEMGGDFLSDLSLREGLIYHLKDALERLRQGSNIRNPFLEQIKLNYGSLFGVVREVASRVFTDVVVPEEEIGFLVIHFGASVERQKQLPERVRALLICSTGIGSSKLLQIRLQKELPQIEIVGRVSWYEAARTDKDKYDLMISTVELPLDRTQYIKVSPLLSQKEVEHLKTYIQTERHRMKSGSYNEETEKTELLAYEQLVNLKSTMDEIVSLISHFEVVQLQEQVEDLQLIIREACFHEREKGVLTEVQKVAQKLMQREQNGSVTIGKRFALFPYSM